MIDETKKDKFKTVFWDMHTITSRVEVKSVGELTQIVLCIRLMQRQGLRDFSIFLSLCQCLKYRFHLLNIFEAYRW